ncbi:hypothetical protein SAMN06296036_103164 [Pseudobacteriovorax antillogorgiicola]|uniref:Uncharacterized protein n=1 Tax=Pseudobacteriovorax antillogorgiicola TaxID=1513793 RepID=A0A1Y6BH53_9BACT|nr:hypothetical protein EDD56_103169 [Pseudobacteriovorax antillogorgiicola]SMF01214.1 hypothetical protein SAMN06296036_103164 [Pseudobacteriovorax antillogorgiicola]
MMKSFQDLEQQAQEYRATKQGGLSTMTCLGKS